MFFVFVPTTSTRLESSRRKTTLNVVCEQRAPPSRTASSQHHERCVRTPVRARELAEIEVVQRERSEVLLRVCGLREGVSDQTWWFMRRPLQTVRFWLCFFPLRYCVETSRLPACARMWAPGTPCRRRRRALRDYPAMYMRSKNCRGPELLATWGYIPHHPTQLAAR